jgi:undecaprenyl-diphosphatase
MLAGVRDKWQRDPRPGALVIVAGVAIAGFLALAAAIVFAPAFVSFDLAVTKAIRAIDVPWLESAALFITRVGDFWPMGIATALTGAVLLAMKRRTSAITLVLAVLSGSLFGSLMKIVFVRVRPALDAVPIPIPETYSFPSGHALTSVLFFGSLVILIMLHERHLKRSVAASALCVLAALSISFSRVYLGVHYLGDVIGSWLLGIAWLALTVVVSARWGASSEADGPVVTESAAAEA